MNRSVESIIRQPNTNGNGQYPDAHDHSTEIDDEILRFLKFIHTHTPKDAFVSISFLADREKQPRAWRSQCYRASALRVAVRDIIGAQAQVFARLTPMVEQPTRGRGTEQDAMGASVLWVDCDHFRNQDEALAAFHALPHAPTMIVSSGNGYHAYWLLDRFETDLLAIKARNKHIMQTLNTLGEDMADSCFDLARVLRVPGTLNTKHGFPKLAKIIEFHPERKYSLTDSEPAEVEAKPQAFEWGEEALPADFGDQLRAKDPKLLDRILTEAGALKAGAEPRQTDGNRVDRSRNDMYIAVKLLGLGYSPGVVLAVLTHPQWFSGEKVRERGRHDYAVTTVNKALDRFSTDPTRYFSKQKFSAPVFCADLLRSERYLYVAEHLWHYEDGVFRPDGRQHLRKEIQSRLGGMWRQAHANEAETWIVDYTARHIEEVNQYRGLINVANGMLGLKTRELHSHNPELCSLVQLPMAFDPQADTTLVDQFVADIIPADTIPVFWEFLGSCLITDRYWPKAFMLLVGEQNGGKSKVIEFIHALFGHRNTAAQSLQTLADNQFMRYELFGKLVNAFSDLDESEAQNTGQIKSITGDDYIQADRKHKNPFKFKNTARLIFSANDYPSVRSPDDAYFGRVVAIPCPNAFTGDKADPEIVAKVTTPASLSGALLRLLEGLERLQKQKALTYSLTVEMAREEYRARVDSATAFISATTEVAPGHPIKKQVLYGMYRMWCQGRGRAPLSDAKFFSRVKSAAARLGITEQYVTLLGKQQWCYVGRKFHQDYVTLYRLDE